MKYIEIQGLKIAPTFHVNIEEVDIFNGTPRDSMYCPIALKTKKLTPIIFDKNPLINHIWTNVSNDMISFSVKLTNGDMLSILYKLSRRAVAFIKRFDKNSSDDISPITIVPTLYQVKRYYHKSRHDDMLYNFDKGGIQDVAK